MFETIKKKKALLIGINEYQFLSKLKYALHDAEAVAESLKRNYRFSDREVVLLTDAKPGQFKPTDNYVIQDQLDKLVDQELDLFIFGFWGHGLFYNDHRYLCPQNVKEVRVEKQGFPFELLLDYLAKIKVKNTCIILDCCQTIHNRGGEDETLTLADQESMENAAQVIVEKRMELNPEIQSNVAILNSCSKGQSAYEWDEEGHGIFTAHLLNAMEKRSRSVVQIANYIRDNIEVTAWELGRDQTPFYKIENDFRLPALPSKKGDVFISYKHCNEKLVAPVLEELERRGISYFIDSEKIFLGAHQYEVLDKAIESCKVLLLFWTEDVHKGSIEIDREVSNATGRNKPVIPYKIGEFSPPSGTIRHLLYNDTNRYDVNEQTPETIIEIVNRIELALAGKNIIPEPEPEQSIFKSELKAGERKTVTVNGVEFAFRWCPPGVFTMGSPESEDERDDNEIQHKETLTNGFWMMETQVTKKQWKAVMGNNPSKCEGDDFPVDNVSWNDCQEFCKKCSQLGMPVELPTELQWEYACRAETTGAYAGDLDEMAWYKENSKGDTHPVREKKSNAWGLYDMHGNVWEWCQDRLKDYQNKGVIYPVCSSDASKCVVRGGSWDSCASFCRSAYRGRCDNEYRDEYLGFRCAIPTTSTEK